jgi:hypothetical protein
LLDERPPLVVSDELLSDNDALSRYPQAKAA